MTEEKVYNRYKVVIGALIIQLCLGSIYAYSAFAKPLKADLGTSDLTNQLPFAFGLFFFALVMVFAGKKQDQLGPRKVAFAGGIVLGIGLILSGFATSIEMLYLTYGVIGGAGIGLAYVCPISALVKWFPDKKGLYSGIAVAGFGAGALIFARVGIMVMTADLDDSETDFLKYKVDDLDNNDLIFLEEETDLTDLEIQILLMDYKNDFENKPLIFNETLVDGDMLKEQTVLEDAVDVSDEEFDLMTKDPADLTPEQKETRKEGFEDSQKAILGAGKSDIYAKFDWNTAFLVLGIIFLVGVAGGSQLLRNPPEGWLPEGWTPPVQKTSTGEEAKADYIMTEMIKTPTFWVIWTMFLLAATSGLMTIGNIGKFAADKDIGVSEITWVIGILSIMNGLGRIIWGRASDMLGRTHSLSVMYSIQGITMLLLYNLGDSYYTLLVGAALVGFCFGGNFAMFPSATADYFGTKSVGQNYGAVFTAYGIAGILGAIIAGTLVESTGSYQSTFMIMGVLSFAAVGLTFFARPPHEKPGITLPMGAGKKSSDSTPKGSGTDDKENKSE